MGSSLNQGPFRLKGASFRVAYYFGGSKRDPNSAENEDSTI